MHDELFALRGALERPALVKAARRLDLDVARFEADLDTAAHLERIEADRASAGRSGVAGTPAFFAGSSQVEGAFDAGSLVDALRAA
jgi:predicted DsbA family dithiol-disulfide isomerase